MENDLQANITGVQVFWDRGANGLAALLSESTGSARAAPMRTTAARRVATTASPRAATASGTTTGSACARRYERV